MAKKEGRDSENGIILFGFWTVKETEMELHLNSSKGLKWFQHKHSPLRSTEKRDETPDRPIRSHAEVCSQGQRLGDVPLSIITPTMSPNQKPALIQQIRQ